MTCAEALELISAKVDSELTEEQDAQLQAHLEGCPRCRSVYEAMTGLEQSLAGLEEPVPEGLKQGVMYRIGQETGKIKKSKKRWIGPGTGFGLVAAVLVLLVGLNVIPLGAKRTATDHAVNHADNSAVQSGEFLPAETPAPEAVYGRDEFTAGFPEAAPGQSEAVKHGSSAEPNAPETSAPGQDNYYLDGRTDESAGEELEPEAPVDETVRAMGSLLSRNRDAAVLVYTEFSLDSLLALLEKEEPELYAQMKPSETEQLENGYLACKTDYRTLLAVHEWLLANLPQSEDMPEQYREAETELMIRMSELDPGSGSLYSVITWSPRQTPVSWPAAWPAGWAVRLRTEENWSLFFPSEDYKARQDDPAWLVFPPEDR